MKKNNEDQELIISLRAEINSLKEKIQELIQRDEYNKKRSESIYAETLTSYSFVIRKMHRELYTLQREVDRLKKFDSISIAG